jgi:hypothetical protein
MEMKSIYSLRHQSILSPTNTISFFHVGKSKNDVSVHTISVTEQMHHDNLCGAAGRLLQRCEFSVT